MTVREWFRILRRSAWDNGVPQIILDQGPAIPKFPLYTLAVHGVDGITVYTIQTGHLEEVRAFLARYDHEGSSIALYIDDLENRNLLKAVNLQLQDLEVFKYLRNRPMVYLYDLSDYQAFLDGTIRRTPRQPNIPASILE